MLKIYSVPVGLYNAKLRIVMRHKGLAFEELPPPGGYGTDEYKKIVPTGNLPAMIDGDLLLADSEAIAEYLEEKYPQPVMMPMGAEQRGIARQLSRFHDTRLEPEVRALFPYIAKDRRNADVNAKQAAALNARLAQLPLVLPQTERTLWLGDCGFEISFVWIEAFDKALDLGIQWPNKVTEYREYLTAQPAVAEEMKSYTKVVDDWTNGR